MASPFPEDNPEPTFTNRNTFPTHFSIVIDKMDKEITATTIRPKIIKLYNEEIHYDRDQQPHTEYHSKEKHGDITDNTVIQWVTDLETYMTLNPQTRSKIDAIKRYINNRAAAISFHDGEADPQCKFHGKHFHIIVQLETKETHITSNSQFRTLRSKMSNYGDWPVYSQRIMNLGNFALYMTKPPKEYLGTNNNNIKLELLKTKAMRVPPPTETVFMANRQRKKPQMYNDIENLLRLMTKYNTSEKNQLITNVHKDPTNQEDKETITSLIRSNTWNIIYKRSQEEFIHQSINPEFSNYYNLFMEHISQEPSDSPQMSIAQTANFVEEWSKEQGIKHGDLILEIYSILRMYHPKRNTFYLQGQSNAGKTYLLHMVLPQKDKVGSHISSRDFPFQECPTKPVILINELTLASQAESELYKNILGGEPTYVNIKNKPATLLHRRPVFLTSNEAIYRFVTNEKIPLLNRMLHHMNLTTSNIIKKYTTKGIPSPGYLAKCFRNIEQVHIALNVPEDETFLDHSQAILSNLSKDLLQVTMQDSQVLPEDQETQIDLPSDEEWDDQTTNKTTNTIGTQTESMEIDQPVIITKETKDTSTQTETQPDEQTASCSKPPVNEVTPFDKKLDEQNNPDSSFTINRQARLSPLWIENNVPQLSPVRYTTPPGSPNPDSSNDLIRATPTRATFRFNDSDSSPIEINTSTPARRRRRRLRTRPYYNGMFTGPRLRNNREDSDHTTDEPTIEDL